MRNDRQCPAPADLDIRVERCRRMVDGLVEIGMKLARTLDPDNGPPPVRDPFLAYCRISRALRLTMMIEARLDALAADGATALAAERRRVGTPAAETEDETQDPAEAADVSEGVQRRETLRDRQDPDEVAQMLRRPMSEIVGMICRDFGLSDAEVREAQAAFIELVANDDGDDPGPGGASVAPPVELRRRSAQRAAIRRWPP